MTARAPAESVATSATLYALLEIPTTATLQEIRRAFRVQIARYHPDKVQHLGKEFQELAAVRAAALNDAYQVLSNEQRRAEYDRALAANHVSSPAVGDTAMSSNAGSGAAPTVPKQPERGAEAATGSRDRFSRERQTRDNVVRRATVNRFQQAVDALGGYDEPEMRGLDVTWRPKTRLFGRGKGPRLFCRLVSRVDRDSLATAWTDAARWSGDDDDVCVFLLGDELATAGELARAIDEQRRRSRAIRVSVIPINARTWEAHVPGDATELAKAVLARVKTGT